MPISVSLWGHMFCWWEPLIINNISQFTVIIIVAYSALIKLSTVRSSHGVLSNHDFGVVQQKQSEPKQTHLMALNQGQPSWASIQTYNSSWAHSISITMIFYTFIFFAVKFKNDVQKKLEFKVPPALISVAALPCEMLLCICTTSLHISEISVLRVSCCMFSLLWHCWLGDRK